MKGKRVIAGFLAGLMFIVPIHVRAEEIAYDIYTFTDMNNLTVSVPANLPLSYSGGIFSGAGDVTVSGMNTSSSDYAVEVSIDSVDIDYINESDNSAIANGVVSFGTNGVESWSEDEISSSISKQISVEVTDFPEVEGIYSSVINYSIEVSETLKDDTYFTKTVDNSTMTCEITGLTDAGKTWVKSAVTNNARAIDVQDTTKAAGELKIPETLVVDGVKYTVTSIGDNAFKSNTDITSVTMAESVTKLGYKVFGECSNLVTCQLSDNITDWGEADVSNESADGSTFWKCSKLETVNIPNGVSVIPRSCFGNCTALKSVEIPANNIVIGHQAFMASGLTSIELPEGTTFSGSTAYATALGRQFMDCKSLVSIDIPESITFIPFEAFYRCYALNGVSLPNTLKEIGFRAFGDCSGLTSFVVPDSCEKIINVAFQNCTGLTSFTMPIDCDTSDTSESSNYTQFVNDKNIVNVTYTAGRTGISAIPNTKYRVPHNCGQSNSKVNLVIEEGVTEITADTFGANTTLKTVVIPSTMTTIGNTAFRYDSYITDLYWDAINAEVSYTAFDGVGRNVTSTLHFGDEVTEIPMGLTTHNDSFNNSTRNRYYNYVDWGSSQITEIKGSQFQYCDLYEIDFPSSVTTIGAYAFNYCNNLKTVTLPEKITYIGSYAFRQQSYYSQLKDVYLDCPNAVMPNTDRSIFCDAGGNNMATVHVGDSYQKHGAETIQTEVIGTIDLYSSAICYIDWGTFKPTKIPYMKFSSLKEIEIPESVAEINGSTFYYSEGLKVVHLTKGTTKIGVSAFSVTAVDTVYYDGTESERYDILTIDSTNNSQLLNATWIYNGEEVPEYKYYSWSYDTTAGTAICTGISEYGKTLGLTSLEIPEKAVSNGVEYTVVGIDEYAFQGNTTITEVTLPDTITSINNGAFENCTKLSSISLSSNLSSLGGWVFKNTGLTSVTLPDSLVSVGNECFRNSTKLSSVTFGTGLETIGDNAFDNTVITAVNASNTNLKSIGGYAFANNSKLTTVSLPDTAVFVGNAERTSGGYQFYKCTALTELTIPSANTVIVGSLCDSCSSLTSVTIPSGVSAIGKYALCVTKIETLDFPKSITHVYQGAFTGCSKLATVNYDGTAVDKSNITIDRDNSPLTNAKWLCDGMAELEVNGLSITCDTINGTAVVSGIADSSVTDIVIPDTVTANGIECKVVSIDGTPFKGNTTITSISVGKNIDTIKAESFRGCSALKSANISGGIALGDNAFRDCRALETITLPDGLESIGSGVFQDCQVMTAVEIPSTVTSIGSGAFWACKRLTEVIIPDGVTTIKANTFDSCSSLEFLGLPVSVTTVEKYAFYGTALSTVIYGGSEADKNSISIAANNNPLTNATWNYAVASTLNLRVIEEIEILEEDGIEIIDADLLAGYPDLKVLILPKTIRGIEENAFANNSLLEIVKYAGSPSQWDAIEIAESGNENLFKAELICLEEDEIIEEEIVEEIEIITEYSISDGVSKIDETMLSKLTDLETITIPVSVVEISANAFVNNTKLVTVNYLGTEGEWSSVVISSEGNDSLFNANITFAECEDTEDELIDSELVEDDTELVEDELTDEELVNDETVVEDSETIDDELTNDDSETSESGDDTSEETTDESVSDETTDMILPDSSEDETSDESSEEITDEVVEETTEQPSIEIQEDTIPIETEEPSASSEDYVAPVKEETIEDEPASSEEDTPEPEVTESTEEEVSESSEETIE